VAVFASKFGKAANARRPSRAVTFPAGKVQGGGRGDADAGRAD